MAQFEILNGDALEILRALPAGTFQTCVTSPPYFGLRDYGVAGQIGLEPTPDEYIARMVAVFREVQRVLRDDGTLWLNVGDSYARAGGEGNCGPNATVGNTRSGQQRRMLVPPAGYKPKDLLMIPAMLALALRADGWFLRSDIIWHKPNPMPESVRDRPTSAHEHVLLLTKQAQYFYDAEAIAEPSAQPDRVRADKIGGSSHKERQQHSEGGLFTGAQFRNARNVWTIPLRPYRGAHFATMPPDLAERCIKAGSKSGDSVLDPFGGAGTTALVANRLGRNATLIELNAAYCDLAEARVSTGMRAAMAKLRIAIRANQEARNVR